jgi:hypothetical protein
MIEMPGDESRTPPSDAEQVQQTDGIQPARNCNQHGV